MRSVEFIVLDASCLLNLYASGRLSDIASALPCRLAVADYVATEEALFVWRMVDGTEEQERVELNPLIDEGLIKVMDLENSRETATFVDFAAQIDDGEAYTCALALHRGWAVASDDRKARRVFTEATEDIVLFSTSELLKTWADETSIPTEELRDALRAIQTGASYVPSQRDPLYSWWLSIISEN